MSKVSFTLETLPAMTPEDKARLAKLAEEPDETIDTSDIPEMTEEQWRSGRLFRPIKEQFTARLDADVLAWLRSGGKGYQTRMNTILRREMLQALQQKRER